jgi:signal transduction histidine kinase
MMPQRTNPHITLHDVSVQFHFLLTLLAERLPLAYGLVLSRAENPQQIDIIAEISSLSPIQRAQIDQMMHDRLRACNVQTCEPLLLDAPLEGIASALLLPLVTADEVIGMIALFGAQPFAPRAIEIARPVATLGRTLLETLYLRSLVDRMVDASEAGIGQVRTALINAVTDSVIMVIPSKNGARVLLANDPFAELFDLDKQQAAHCSLSELIARLPLAEPLRRELERTWLNIAVRDPEKHSGAFTMTHAAGHTLDLEWYSAPVFHGDYIIARLFIIYDRTAERTAQRLRSAFISRVSHELRTPLTSISGFAEFILEATGSQLPDLAREYTEIILSSARHLTRVFNDIIEITRADSGETRLRRAAAHLPDVIIDVVARLEMTYKARGQQVIMQLDDDLPEISIDVDRVAQILTNLLTNAIKYSPPATAIRVCTDYIEMTEQLPPGAPLDVMLPAVLISVIDEGEGLANEDVERVFLPFFRTESARISRTEGVGLGLAVTRSIVEMHRGKIWAEPRQGDRQGGRFFFTLPI